MTKHDPRSDERVAQMLERYVREQHGAAPIQTKREQTLTERLSTPVRAAA